MNTTTAHNKHWSVELQHQDACSAAIAYAQTHTSFQEAWSACSRGDWLLWWLGRTLPNTQTNRENIACIALKIVLAIPQRKFIPKWDEWATQYLAGVDRTALSAARATRAAEAAAEAARAARAAAWAARAATEAAEAAWAAAEAVEAAAWAAAAAAGAAKAARAARAAAWAAEATAWAAEATAWAAAATLPVVDIVAIVRAAYPCPPSFTK